MSKATYRPCPTLVAGKRPPKYQAFTLVELLVVIGIIALLISILLPALNNARRQAAQTKCAAQMKQLHVACLMYAQDNKNYYPPAKMTISTANGPLTYSLYDATFPIGTNQPYWFDFLSKYLTKKKIAVTSTTADEAADARNSVIWGCPSWDGYASTAIGGINRGQTGIGMGGWPTMTNHNPEPSTIMSGNEATYFPKPSEMAVVTLSATGVTAGSFAKGTTWGRQSANRLLFSDSRFWFTESRPAPADGSFPEQSTINGSATYSNGDLVIPQTLVDVYRHGKYPGLGSTAQTMSKKGGKVAYNILYADGHVASCNDQKPAYESVRQRYPG